MGVDMVENKSVTKPIEAKLYYLNDSRDWVEVGDVLSTPVHIDRLIAHNDRLYGISFSGGKP